MATFIPLADAVKEMLNANEFSRQFTAARIYDPLRKLDEMETMRVDVLLGDKQIQALDRTRLHNDCRIEIAVRQVIKPLVGSDAEQTELDDLVGFMEEIGDFLAVPANRRPPAANWAGWQKSELVYPFLPAHLRGSHQFTSLLRITYFVVTG